MRLELKGFQEAAVQQLLEEAVLAANEVKLNKHQAIVFSAPTGSGKTVVATAFMERVYDGDEEYDPDPEATFLWLTDQPELNEQTKRKLQSGSTVFDEESLVTVEPAKFDQRVFEPGKVFFLNIQKLGKGSSMTKLGDKRQFSIWQTIANTLAERPGSFWLIIDEAHRGMKENGKGKQDKSVDEAQSLAQKLIKGSEEDGLAPVPLLLGISATPERFNKLIEGTPRTKRAVVVEPEDVRSSGLLKESITLYHTDEKQPSDITLLAAAAAKLKEFQEAWLDYAEREEETEVRPILVVQVEDGTKTKLTKTDMEASLKAIEQAVGPLKDEEVAHCFQEGGQVEAGGRELRYIAPSDVEDDPDIRVVFFKMALTTGWDCPRAEVMMSFRAATDDTLIAQLVGRMVRTPLARSVSGSELLETVCLYLPYYDRDALDEIIDRLSKPDPDNGLPGTTVRRGNKLTKLKPDPALKDVFDAIKGLPMYKAQRVSRKSALRRYISLGRELAWDGLETKQSVKDEFSTHCVAALKSEYERLKSTEDFKTHYEEAGRIDVRSVKVQTGTKNTSDEELSKLPVLEENIGHAHKEAGRTLGGGLHAAYVNARFAEGGMSLSELKRELWALLKDADVLNALEQEAQTRFDAAYDKHKADINKLSDERKQKYRTLRQASAAPPEEEWNPPHDIEGSKEGDAFDKHLFVRDTGGFVSDGLNSLEKKVLAEELSKDEVVAWLRNEPRKSWAFSLAYERGGEFKTMYPDFLVFRKQGKNIITDVLEPHSQSQADSVAKAAGLAKFAQKHHDAFGRIELIDEIDGELKRLALHDPKVAKQVAEVTTEGHLRQLFEAS